jgi:alpha-tubulin suppressor-like RCC1 family protein/sugar lactone lactonase YvrE
MNGSSGRAVRLVGIFFLVVACLALPVAPAAATGSGVVNPGFEQGLLGWRHATGTADSAVVVAAEGPQQFPVYDTRGVTVDPFTGDRMLRLGLPRPKGSQPKGTTTVSQTFTPTSSTMLIALRVFSWEFRGEDEITIDLTDASQHHLGCLSRGRDREHERERERERARGDHRATDRPDPIIVTMSDGTVVTPGTMPLTITPRSALKNALLDTGWISVSISGIPVGSPLTLTYSLNAGKDSSHPTWAYFDEVNLPPTVVGRSFDTDANTPLVASAPGVLASATDPEGDALTASVVTSATHGAVRVFSDGSFSYAPVFGFVGTDSFTFKANDGQSDSNVGTVVITVKTVTTPMPATLTTSTPENVPVHVNLPAIENGRPLTYFVVGPPDHGLVSGIGGDLEYSPATGWSGTDSFTFYASDGLLYWKVGMVQIVVTPVNQPPVAFEIKAATNAGKPVALVLEASDPESDPLTFEIVRGPANGELSPIAGATLTYTPKPSFCGTETFTYRAKDGKSYSETATATITVDPLFARFEYLPTDPREGEDVGVFGDLSGNLDGEHSVVEGHWTVAGPYDFADSFDGVNSFFTPPVEGSYDVTLTVVDDRGSAATTHTVITVVNDAPRVKALNLEVLPGRPATVLGRFLDAGWTDTHTAGVDFPGARTAGLAEDHFAVLSSGMVTATVTTNVGGPGTLTVSDDGGDSVTVPFTVSVIQPGSDRSASKDTFADRNDPVFPKARGDGSYLSYIKSAGDVDLYEVLMPNGKPLPYGTEILASLKGLPADYDLAILTELPSADIGTPEMQGVPFEQGTDGSTALQSSGSSYRGSGSSYRGTGSSYRGTGSSYRGSGSSYRGSGSSYRGSGSSYRGTGSSYRGTGSSYRGSYGRYDALEMLTFPLSDMSYTGLDAGNLGGGDITMGDLGLTLPQGADIVMADFSANRGTADEAAIARTETFSDRVYVAVFGANGAFDAETPYTLEVETAQPLELQDVFGAVSTPDPIVPADERTTAPVVLNEAASTATETLFITQRERMIATYGQPAWDALVTDLSALCTSDTIKGEIVSVPSDIYDGWDTNPSSVASANEVTDEIRDVITAKMKVEPSIRYVVFVGNDRIVPFRRVADDTLIGNEFYYRASSFLLPDSPLYASLTARCILTDDFYADAAPIAWQGRALYVPDVSVARLVETPAEIRGSIKAYVEKDGVMDPATSLVTGYDFFTDGASAASDTLGAARLDEVNTLVGAGWSGDDLRAALFGQTGGAHDINDINAHFTHYAGLSAQGWASYDATQELTSIQVSSAVANGSPALLNKLWLTLGCRAGLSVPDTDAVKVDPSWGIDPSLDFAQAMARQGAVYLANTGAGLGDVEAVACSELLNKMYLEELLQNGGATVGSALTASKQRYVTSLAAMTPYDEKTSIEFTLYGLPQYRVTTEAGPLSRTVASGGSMASASLPKQGATLLSTEPSGTFTLSISDEGGAAIASEHTLMANLTDSGAYLTADGDAQASDSRPIQPRIVVPIEHTTQGDVHGVLLGDGSFSESDGFDPVIARTSDASDDGAPENTTVSDGLWPASPTTLRSLETTSDQLVQNLMVLPGQFGSTSSEGATVTGVERKWDALDVELLRSHSAHWTPPEITGVRLYSVSPTQVSVAIDAMDSVGIGRIVVSRFTGSGVESQSVVPANPDAGTFVVPVTVTDNTAVEDLSFVVQVADTVGNVAVSSGKGAAAHVVAASIEGLASTYDQYAVIPFAAHIPEFASLVQPVSYVWDFGDGSASSGLLAEAVPLDDAGAVRLSAEHTYLAPGTYGLRLTVSDALGGMGSAQATVHVAPSTAEWISYDTGISHTAAVKRDGTLWTWGSNAYGQLGNGVPTSALLPTRVGSGTDWLTVACGANHTVAIKGNGELWAWGNNDSGQVGNGTWGLNPVTAPVRIGTDTDWASVGGGHTHTLAIKRNGELWAWGNNANGRLGDGTTVSRTTPTRIGTDSDWASVAGALSHSLGIKRGGALFAWGGNANGQLGIGSQSDQPAPAQVMVGAGGWKAIACAGSSSIGVMQDGSLWTWGLNSSGQLGDGATWQRTAPGRLGLDSDWAAVGSGGSHQAAVKSDGTLWTWGANPYGQLGDGTTTTSTVPVRFGNATDYVSVACLTNHTAGLDRFGRLWMSGLNASGQLGNGDTANRRVPTLVGSASGAAAVPSYAGQFAVNAVPLSSGVYHMAVAADGSLYVADLDANQVHHYTAAGTLINELASPGQFNMPFGVAVSPLGPIFVADTFRYRIESFSPTGTILAAWGSYGTGDWQFANPRAVAVSRDGAFVVVADTGNSRIQRYGPGGERLDSWGALGTGGGEFNQPFGVAVAPDGSVYVADTYNHRIQHFAAGSFAFLGAWGGQGTGEGQFNFPHGVAVGPDGSVYVADTSNCRIQRFGAEGAFIGSWGTFGNGDGQFNTPRDVAVAPDGSVYVVDTNNRRIQHFTYTP